MAEIDRFDNLVERLGEVQPRLVMLKDTEDCRAYECDGLVTETQLPRLVILPDTVEQVSAILKHCHECQIPVVVRGAGTGLSGGAMPCADGVLLSLAKLHRIIEIDPDNRYARVQPGVRNEAISVAADEFGLFYAPDPTSQVACTIGGNIAVNAGGLHCVKYGPTVEHALELKIVTAEGELVDLGNLAIDPPGYDLIGLLTGSEAQLGVIVEATVRLLPRPQTRQLLIAGFATIDGACRAAAAIVASGIRPAALELLEAQIITALKAHRSCAFPATAAAVLLCELDGMTPEVEQEMETLQSLLRRYEPNDSQVITQAAELSAVWAARQAAFAALGRLAPNHALADGIIPPQQLPKVMDGILALADTKRLRITFIAHAGEATLYLIVLYDANDTEAVEAVSWLVARVLALYLTVGGSVVSECGIGTRKRDAICSQLELPALNQLHRLKRALDRDALLNPGKTLPDLHRCAKLGSGRSLAKSR